METLLVKSSTAVHTTSVSLSIRQRSRIFSLLMIRLDGSGDGMIQHYNSSHNIRKFVLLSVVSQLLVGNLGCRLDVCGVM